MASISFFLKNVKIFNSGYLATITLKIILCNQYYDYSYACSVFGIQSLEERRFRLCTKFAVKEYRRGGSMFTKYRPKYSLKNYRTKLVEEIFCNSSRYYNSSLPFLSRLLNSISNDPSWTYIWRLLYISQLLMENNGEVMQLIVLFGT